MREERRITDLFTWRQISLCDLGGVSFWEPEMFKVISPNRGDAVSHRTFYRSSPFCPLLLWTGAGIVGIHLGYWFRQEPISTIFSWGFSCLRVIHKPKLSLTVNSNKFYVYVVYGQIHARVCRKNLTYPNFYFGKWHYAFYPMKLSLFAEKKSSSQIPKIHKGGLLQTEPHSSQSTKNFKSQTLFWRVLGIQTSLILLNMVNLSLVVICKKNWNPNPTQPQDT